MFSLLYGLIDYIFRKDELRILILGLDKAGKTTLLERLKCIYSNAVALGPDKIRPTVGLNVGRIDAFKAKLIFWDLGGQAGLRTIWDKYYTETHGVIFVVDGTNQDRIDEAKMALDKVLGSKELMGAPLLVLANKMEEVGHVGENEIMEQFGLGSTISVPCRVMSVCALDGTGVENAVTWLIEAVRGSSRPAVLRDRLG